MAPQPRQSLDLLEPPCVLALPWPLVQVRADSGCQPGQTLTDRVRVNPETVREHQLGPLEVMEGSTADGHPLKQAIGGSDSLLVCQPSRSFPQSNPWGIFLGVRQAGCDLVQRGYG
jgi:hypothetical protein